MVVVMAPLEIVSRYEAPFRTAGLNPGLVTTSGIAALDLLAPGSALTVIAKLTGRVLTVLVATKAGFEAGALPGTDRRTRSADVAAVLYPTFVYIEDNLGAQAEKLMLCGFGAQRTRRGGSFAEELGVEVEPLRSPWRARERTTPDCSAICGRSR